MQIHPNNWWQRFKAQWNPTPISQPSIDPKIEEMEPLQRSAEVIRYSILSIEFWISPNGQVREWLRNNTHLAAWLAIPAFLILPIATFALCQLALGLEMLVSIAGKLIVFPILALIATCVIWIGIKIVKSIR
jgi:hypothetical protein